MNETTQEEMKAFHKSYKAFRKNITQYKTMVDSNLIPLVETVSGYRDKVSCFKGCSWCCHYRVAARTHEIIAIYSHINTKLPHDLTQKIKGEVLETALKIDGMSNDEHENTNTKCPMLHAPCSMLHAPCSMLQDDKCSVYTVRPTKCAGYYSTSDSDCEKLFNLTKKVAGSIIIDIDKKRHLQDEKMDAVINYEGHDTNQYELVTSLALLFNNSQLIARWRKNGKPIFTRLG